MYVTYNNITMRLMRTNSFAVTPVFSPDGTDFIYYRVEIDVTCVYAPGATAVVPGGVQVGYNRDFPVYADVTTASLKQILSIPRQGLIIAGDNTVIIASPDLDANVDAKDGPKPLGTTVVQVTGSRNYLVRWRCETYLSDCNFGGLILPGAGISPIVSNRWSQAQSIDGECKTTIITQGMTVFRSDVLTALGNANQLSLGADFFRANILPQKPLHFKRSLNVEVTPLGNIITWRCVDEEQFIDIGTLAGGDQTPNPWGVVSFEGMYGQNTIPMGGGLIQIPGPFLIENFDGVAVGHTRASKDWLRIFLMQLAMAKLNLGDPRTTGLRMVGQPIVRTISVREHVHKPIVAVHIEAVISKSVPRYLAMGALRADLLGLDADDVVTLMALSGSGPFMKFPNSLPAGTNPGPTYDTGTRANYWGEMFTQAITSACVTPFTPTLGLCQLPNPNDNYSLLVECRPFRDPRIPLADYDTFDGFVDPENTDYVNSIYKTSMEYFQNTGMMASPVATRPPTTSPGAGGGTGGSGGGSTTQAFGSPTPTSGATGGTAFGVKIPDNIPNPYPVGAQKIMSMSGPRTYIRWKVVAERINKPPVLPAFVSSDPTQILLDIYIKTTDPLPTNDGAGLVYRTECTYTYAVNKSNAIATTLYTGANPAYIMDYGDDDHSIECDWTTADGEPAGAMAFGITSAGVGQDGFHNIHDTGSGGGGGGMLSGAGAGGGY
jgi:hypothetical protein